MSSFTARWTLSSNLLCKLCAWPWYHFVHKSASWYFHIQSIRWGPSLDHIVNWKCRLNWSVCISLLRHSFICIVCIMESQYQCVIFIFSAKISHTFWPNTSQCSRRHQNQKLSQQTTVMLMLMICHVRRDVASVGKSYSSIFKYINMIAINQIKCRKKTTNLASDFSLDYQMWELQRAPKIT